MFYINESDSGQNKKNGNVKVITIWIYTLRRNATSLKLNYFEEKDDLQNLKSLIFLWVLLHHPQPPLSVKVRHLEK